MPEAGHVKQVIVAEGGMVRPVALVVNGHAFVPGRVPLGEQAQGVKPQQGGYDENNALRQTSGLPFHSPIPFGFNEVYTVP